MGREEFQRHSYSGVDGAYALGYGGESTGQDENPHHIENVGVPGRLGEKLEAGGKRLAPANNDTPHRGRKKSHSDRHFVEIADNQRDNDI